MATYKGIAGLGNITNISNYNKIKDYVVGPWRFRLELGDVNPSPGVYDWTDFESWVDIVVADDKYFSFQINVSPTSIDPAWIFLPPYNVPKVTGASGQVYPYYLNANFIAIKQAALDNLRNRIENVWSSTRRNKLVSWLDASGKTGDEGTGIEDPIQVTINGVPQSNVSDYAITSDEWTAIKRADVWPQFYDDLAADIPTCLMALNPSNNGESWQWFIDNLPTALPKVGQPTHNYNNVGELFYAIRVNALTATLPTNMSFGEFESTNDSGWFQISTRQNTFALLLSAITHGVCSFNISYATFNEVINVNNAADFWMFEFANEYMGVRDASTTSIAMISLRDCLDGADMNRFPVVPYLPFVASGDQAAYNSRYNKIINSDDPQDLKDDKIANLGAQYLNPARRARINADFPNLVFAAPDTGNDHDAYNQDGGVYMIPDNYGKWITQYSPNTTSEGYARIGATNQPHGRNCRATDDEMYFAIDTAIVSNNSYQVEFTVWYYDEGSRQWSFNYWNGTAKVNLGVYTNTNTNAWIEKTISIPVFYGGGNIEFDTDFSIKSEDGSKTKIETITFERIAQNSTGTSGIYLRGNNVNTVCDQSVITLYTDGAFGVGKVLYTDAGLTTIMTGYAYIVATANSHIYTVNSGTGVVLTDAGFICNSGTVGTYILGNNSGTVCAGAEVDLYTSGAFAIGKTLYADADLITPQTGFDFLVKTDTNTIYNLNSATGVIGTATGSSCTGGTSGTYKTGNNSSTVCAAGNIILYTDGSFNIGSILYTDIGLTTPATGFTFVVRTSNSNIYSVNSGTGTVTAQVGKCNGGTAESFKVSNSLSGICSQVAANYYTDGTFAIGKILYSDINLVTPVTGYDYLARVISGIIYNLNDSTGLVGSETESICDGGTETTVRLGNNILNVCAQSTVSVYTDGRPALGKVVFSDINLTTPLTGYSFAVRVSNGKIYGIDNITGEILSSEGSCGSGNPYAVRLGNDLDIICGADSALVYVANYLEAGVFIYTNINLTTPVTGYNYVVAPSGLIYVLNSITGEVVSNSGSVCQTGASDTYKLGNDPDTICAEDNVELFLVDVFTNGAVIYNDIHLTEPTTGYSYIVNVANKKIYRLNNATGEIGRPINQNCRSQNDEPTVEYQYNIVADKSTYRSVMRSVLIDARATTMPKNATGYQIDAVVNAAIAQVNNDVIFYKLETGAGNLVGYFTLTANPISKTVIMSSLVLRPAFEKNITIISEQINNFIINRGYQNNILT